jgi:hypothetical protein
VNLLKNLPNYPGTGTILYRCGISPKPLATEKAISVKKVLRHQLSDHFLRFRITHNIKTALIMV